MFYNLDQGIPLACFYSTLGLNRELNSEPSSALNYYLKALDVWKNCNEIGFVLITLKHLINLAPKAGLNVADTANFMKLYQKLLQADDFKGVNVENLFKDYENRLQAAEMITLELRAFEESLPIDEKNLMSTSQIYEENQNVSEPFWKQALRLRLLKSLKMAKHLVSSQSEKIVNIKKGRVVELLASGTDQILSTLSLLNDEINPVILNKLQTMAYTKDAINGLRAAINKIRKFIMHQIYGIFFKGLSKKSQIKALNDMKKMNTISPLVSKCYKIILSGDYLIKCNNSSNGRIRKFFKLDVSGKLLIANKEIYIDNATKNREINLEDVQALIYGKSSINLLKLYNKPLESYLCFSIEYKNKYIDFYCTDEQIKPWIIGLSKEIKKKNPLAFTMNPGRLIWRGFRLRVLEIYKKTMEKEGKIKKFNHQDFTKAILFLAKRKMIISEKPKKF